MTTVLPAWKQALIEKKRKKEREQQTKFQEDSERIASVPEWKRNILSKRKEAQIGGAERTRENSPSGKNHSNLFSGTVTGKGSPSSVQAHSNHSDAVSGRNTGSVSSKGSTNSRGSSQNGFSESVEHSAVTIGKPPLRPPAEQQRQNKHGTEKSINIKQFENSSGCTQNYANSIPDPDVKVAYEHVRPPSELRRIFEESNSKRRYPDPSSAAENQDNDRDEKGEVSLLNSAFYSAGERERYDHVKAVSASTKFSPKPYKSSTFDAKRYRAGTSIEQIQTNTESISKDNEQISLRQTDSEHRESREDLEFEFRSSKKQQEPLAPVKDIPPESNKGEMPEVFILSLKDNDSTQRGFHDNEHTQSKEHTESSSEVHVNALRNRFGPVGKFRHRSCSVENLSTASSDDSEPPVVLRSHPRSAPPLNKRWSADVLLMSASRSIDDDDHGELGLTSDHKLGSPLRLRSMSLHEIREEHGPEPLLQFRHRASISYGIERRVHELLRQVSHSEGHTEDDEEDNDMDDLWSEDGVLAARGVSPVAVQKEGEPTKVRATAWSEVEADSFTVERKQESPINHDTMESTQVQYRAMPINEPPQHTIKDSEINTPLQKKVMTINKENKEDENIPSKIEVTSFKEPPTKQANNVMAESERRVILIPRERKELNEHATAAVQYPIQNGEFQECNVVLDSVLQEGPSEQKMIDVEPPQGSVHKLSALFGSSILKSSKKDKKKIAKKVDNKKNTVVKLRDDEKVEVKKEKVKVEKSKHSEETKSSGTSMIFPWLKNKDEKKNSREPKFKPVKGEQKDKNVEPTMYSFKGSTTNLRSVQHKTIEQKITGKMTLVINADTDPYPSGPKRKQYFDNSFLMNNNDKKLPKLKPKQDIRKEKPIPVTPIDVPISDIGSSSAMTNDVEVSAIDFPESPASPTPVSIIDMPESAKDDVIVSVIDVPEQFKDGWAKIQNGEVNVDDDSVEEDSDDSESGGHSGSYDVTIGNQLLTLSFGESSDEVAVNKDSTDEEEEDIDDVPVSYIGDSTYMTVPEVIFETEREDLKSCVSSPLVRRKKDKKVKVLFPTEHLYKIHNYPSEECFTSHFDQYMKENGGKTLNNYKPSTVENFEDTLKKLRDKEAEHMAENKKMASVSSSKSKDRKDVQVTKITYSNEGDGFTTSSSSSGALLF